MAAAGGYDIIVELLLELKADPHVKNHENVSPVEISLNAKVLKVF